MKAKYIPYSQIAIFSSLIQDYLSEHPALKEFTTYSPDVKGFAEKLQHYRFQGNRTVLTQVLEQQYAHVNTHKETQKNITLLHSENTFTITTGHQLNIFTGPLYFIFKIASTIKLCLELKAAFPDKNFVPVYWMATEDHDFEEINHTFVADKKITWPIATQGATGAVGIQNFEKCIQEYEAFLGVSKHANTLITMVKTAYLEHQNLADATQSLVNDLFGSYGLVIINAQEKALKSLFAPVMQKDMMEQNSFKNISATNEKLSALGYKIQVQPREINFFYLDANLRARIVFEEGKYQVLNTSIAWSAEELQAEIQQHPEKFSPNVVMRPLYQELILPNLAYIGGAGEMAYWLQLKSNFEAYCIDFPILLVRNSAMWMDTIAQHYQSKLNINNEALFESIKTLQHDFVTQHAKNNLSITPQKNEIHTIIEALKLQVQQVDVNLEKSAGSLQTKIEYVLDRFEKKIFKAEKRHHEDGIRQIEKLKNRVFPNGGLQERKENFAVIYKDYGPEFIDFIIQHFRPLQKEFTLILAPNESI